MIHVYTGTKFPIYIQCMVAKRGITNRANIPMKKSFKTQHGRIPIDRASLFVIGHRFKKRKLKMLTRGSEVTHMEIRNILVSCCNLCFLFTNDVFFHEYLKQTEYFTVTVVIKCVIRGHDICVAVLVRMIRILM